MQGSNGSLPINWGEGASKETFNSVLINTGLNILDKWPELHHFTHTPPVIQDFVI